MISKLHKACTGYDEWKASNNPTYKPWLHPEQNALPVLNKADILPINNNSTNEEPSDETDITEDQVNENLERWELCHCFDQDELFLKVILLDQILWAPGTRLNSKWLKSPKYLFHNV